MEKQTSSRRKSSRDVPHKHQIRNKNRPVSHHKDTHADRTVKETAPSDYESFFYDEDEVSYEEKKRKKKSWKKSLASFFLRKKQKKIHSSGDTSQYRAHSQYSRKQPVRNLRFCDEDDKEEEYTEEEYSYFEQTDFEKQDDYSDAALAESLDMPFKAVRKVNEKARPASPSKNSVKQKTFSKPNSQPKSKMPSSKNISKQRNMREKDVPITASEMSRSEESCDDSSTISYVNSSVSQPSPLPNSPEINRQKTHPTCYTPDVDESTKSQTPEIKRSDQRKRSKYEARQNQEQTASANTPISTRKTKIAESEKTDFQSTSPSCSSPTFKQASRGRKRNNTLNLSEEDLSDSSKTISGSSNTRSKTATLSKCTPLSSPQQTQFAEGEPESDVKAHYLMVEVIYHGRSLENNEKSVIQNQVTRLVDGILKGSLDTSAPEEKKEETTEKSSKSVAQEVRIDTTKPYSQPNKLVDSSQNTGVDNNENLHQVPLHAEPPRQTAPATTTDTRHPQYQMRNHNMQDTAWRPLAGNQSAAPIDVNRFANFNQNAILQSPSDSIDTQPKAGVFKIDSQMTSSTERSISGQFYPATTITNQQHAASTNVTTNQSSNPQDERPHARFPIQNVQVQGQFQRNENANNKQGQQPTNFPPQQTPPSQMMQRSHPHAMETQQPPQYQRQNTPANAQRPTQVEDQHPMRDTHQQLAIGDHQQQIQMTAQQFQMRGHQPQQPTDNQHATPIGQHFNPHTQANCNIPTTPYDETFYTQNPHAAQMRAQHHMPVRMPFGNHVQNQHFEDKSGRRRRFKPIPLTEPPMRQLVPRHYPEKTAEMKRQKSFFAKDIPELPLPPEISTQKSNKPYKKNKKPNSFPPTRLENTKQEKSKRKSKKETIRSVDETTSHHNSTPAYIQRTCENVKVSPLNRKTNASQQPAPQTTKSKPSAFRNSPDEYLQYDLNHSAASDNVSPQSLKSKFKSYFTGAVSGGARRKKSRESENRFACQSRDFPGTSYESQRQAPTEGYSMTQVSESCYDTPSTTPRRGSPTTTYADSDVESPAIHQAREQQIGRDKFVNRTQQWVNVSTRGPNYNSPQNPPPFQNRDNRNTPGNMEMANGVPYFERSEKLPSARMPIDPNKASFGTNRRIIFSSPPADCPTLEPVSMTTTSGDSGDSNTIEPTAESSDTSVQASAGRQLPQSNTQTTQMQNPGGRWHQSSSPEHEAWWMPKEWAQERRIGAFKSEWSYDHDDKTTRQREHQISRTNPNVEKIRTSNFIRI